LSAGAPPQTPLGELTALPRPPSWILGGLFLREVRGGREGIEEKRREEKGREGRDPLFSRYTPSHYILDKGLILKIYLYILKTNFAGRGFKK